MIPMGPPSSLNNPPASYARAPSSVSFEDLVWPAIGPFGGYCFVEQPCLLRVANFVLQLLLFFGDLLMDVVGWATWTLIR